MEITAKQVMAFTGGIGFANAQEASVTESRSKFGVLWETSVFLNAGPSVSCTSVNRSYTRSPVRSRALRTNTFA